jgi:FPC/CPF motif-containing protein YcgG
MQSKPKGFDDYWVFDEQNFMYRIKEDAPDWAKEEYEQFYKNLNQD